jgi:ATP-dependent DNA helicase RecG
MNIDKKDESKFQKLHVNSFIALALHVPSSYEDRQIYDQIMPFSQVIDATIEHVSKTPKSLQITFFAHNLSQRIQGVFFHPKPYMLRMFSKGESGYFFGKINHSTGQLQISHPQKVTEVGQITPKYKSALRSDVMQRLCEKYIQLENLSELEEDIALALYEIHHPSSNLLKSSNFEGKYLEALKYAELYEYMRSMQNKRRYFDSLTCKANDPHPWIQSLPFTLTDEQHKAIHDVYEDMSKSVAAKRVIVGDVGSGKTMVILASAYMNTPNKTILMAPTTILANQLYEEALKFLPKLSITLVTNKSKKSSLEPYDFIIGTHALLYRELPLASLVMVDEQHRFGTTQRALLEKLVTQGKQKPHFLQFSATPIPRTQAMIDSSFVDVSLITKTPFKKDITTSIIHKSDFSKLLEHIKSEISKNNQILIIYPLVEQSEMIAYQSIDEARGYWEKNFENVYVTHGKDANKESVLVDFRDLGDILIATTVVEVGISLPRLSSVIIVGAERLGLSTLHQLRGRVSRTGLKGYCFLYTNQESSKRLEEFSRCESGFDIAMLDLKFRSSGDLLAGKNQSGKEFHWVDLSSDENVIFKVKQTLKAI